MAVQGIGFQHLTLRSAEDVFEMFRLLGYSLAPDTHPFENDELEALELDPVDAEVVQRAYVVSQHDNHTVWLYEVSDISQIRLRGLAWNALQRGTALLVITRDYREILFVDPRFVGNPTKSNVRVNKLKMVVSDATRHDLDTLNAIHAFRRTGQQIYDAQATAFNVTAITKKFYEEYRRYYEKARTAVRQYNKGIREFQDEDQTDKLHAFTQRLMGRLMFLYFLQRKGWLGGRPKFLTDQYQAAIRDHASEIRGNDETFYYYREVLEPLFFETMNTRRPDNVTRWSGIRIPYLNGGLFDEGRDPTGPIILPDSLFDLHDGLLAFFNRYNFTIADDTPLEQDVAVDPEMLGKVFENMLEERDRGQSGSFYTPRAIVAYMCQEALAGYLEESATVSRETVRAQFDPDSTVQFTPEEAEHVNAALDTLTVLDPAVGSGSFLIGMLHEIIRVRKAAYLVLHGDEAPRTTLAAWKEQIIRDTLYGVDIKPEAIEIAQLRLWLALVVDQTLEEAHPLPNLDYKLMAGNSLIETLDGEPVLSEKAMLYLESDHGTNIHAPTQDNFLGIPTQSRMALFEGEAAVESQHRELANLRRDYFSASPDNRRALRQEITRQERNIVLDSLREKANHAQQLIDKIGKKIQDAQSTAEKSKSQQVSKRDIDQLNAAVARLERLQNLMADIANPDKPLPFFLYRLQFSDVFKTKGGFDVVIANPPYVRQELIRDQKPELEASYPHVYAGTADLFVYFFARAHELLCKNGYLSFITPNKFMRANYGKKLREYLAKEVTLHTLIDFGDLPLFDATTYPMITVASHQAPNDNKVKVLEVTELDETQSLRQAADRAFNLPQSALSKDGWQLSAPEIRALMDKLQTAGKPLGKYVDGAIYYGIKTGLNEAFIIDAETRAELIAQDPKSAEVIKPYLRGRDVKRWQVESAGLYMLYIPWHFKPQEYPAIFEHLKKFDSQLSARPEVKDGRFPWFAMSRYASDYVEEFEKPKILSARFMTAPLFGYDNGNHYTNDACYLFPGSEYILAFLNSSAGWFFLTQVATMMQNHYYQIHVQYLEQIPIPDAPDDLRQKIASLAQQCLDTAQDNPDQLPALESELNALVYQAYGLNEDEIAVIDRYLAGQSTQNVEIEDSEAFEE